MAEPPPLTRLRLTQAPRVLTPIDLPHDLLDILVAHAINERRPCTSVPELCKIHPEWAELCRKPWRIYDAANRALGFYGALGSWPAVEAFYRQNYPDLQMLFTSGQEPTPKTYFKWVCRNMLYRVDNVNQRHPWFPARLLQVVTNRPLNRPWFRDIVTRLPNYAEIAKLYMVGNPGLLRNVPQNHPGFHEIALVALERMPDLFQYVSTTCDDYDDLAKFAVQLPNSQALAHVRRDRPKYQEIATLAVEADARQITHVPRDAPFYTELAKIAVEQDGRALAFVPGAGTVIDRHPDFFEIAKVAIEAHGWPIQYVANGVGLPGDHSDLYNEYIELAKIAMRHKPLTIADIPRTLPEYRELAVIAIEHNWKAIDFVPTSRADFTELRAISDRVRNAVDSSDSE